MLVLLPPSESKEQQPRGRALDLGRLSFRELDDARQQVLAAAITTSARPDAVARLGVPPGVAAEVTRNVDLASHRTTPAARLYQGVLYDALDLDSLDATARGRATRWVIITSALFGAVRLSDPLPPYRLPICARLDGMGGLEAHWRAVLDPVMTAAAGRGLVVDCRSSSYVPLWRPTGDLAERWVQVRVPGASHHAKHTRGLLTRHLCTTGSTARTPAALAEEAAEAFTVELHAPPRPGKPWVLDVAAPG